MFGFTFITDTLCCFGIKRACPLFFPVQLAAGIAHTVVDVSRMGNLFCDIGGMSGDLAGWFIQSLELLFAAAIVIGGRL